MDVAVLCFDTDSVIFFSKPGDPEPPLGPYLDELTGELNGEHVNTFVSWRPRNCSYRTNTGKVEIKIRGIILNCAAREVIKFDVIRELVYMDTIEKEKCNVVVNIPYKITRGTQATDITKRMKKDYRIIIVDNYKILPYGY